MNVDISRCDIVDCLVGTVHDSPLVGRMIDGGASGCWLITLALILAPRWFEEVEVVAETVKGKWY